MNNLVRIYRISVLLFFTSRLIFRPTNVVGLGLRLYPDYIFLLFFFSVSYPLNSLNGTQPEPAISSKVSAI